jgi:hypothetical protein
VFFGRVAAVHRARQQTLDAQYALHPNRFPNGAPKAALPPAEVHINPLEAIAVPVVKANAPASDKDNRTAKTWPEGSRPLGQKRR